MSPAPAPITLAQYWSTLINLENILMIMLDTMHHQPEAMTDKRLAEIRIAERTLNSLYNYIMHVPVEDSSFISPVAESQISREQWGDFLRNRDKIADTVSNLIEANPAALQRYNDYCENLKNLRSLGAML